MKSVHNVLDSSRIDSIGAFLSLACAIHCTLLPGLAAALPLLALESIISEPVHYGILVGTVILGIGSCTWGFHRHKKHSPVFLFCLGILIVMSSFFVQETHHEVTAALGALFLAFGHIVNQAFCRSCVECQTQK